MPDVAPIQSPVAWQCRWGSSGWINCSRERYEEIKGLKPDDAGAEARALYEAPISLEAFRYSVLVEWDAAEAGHLAGQLHADDVEVARKKKDRLIALIDGR